MPPTWQPTRHRCPDRGTEVALATLVLVLVSALGVLVGLLWQWLTPGAEVAMTGDGPVHADPTSESYFADDGWFVLISAITGVIVALVCWIRVPRHRGPVMMIGMVTGCLVGAVVAWQVGRHVGLAGFRELLEHAPTGREFRRPAKLVALGALGVQAFTATFAYTLLAGWCHHPLLRRPEPGETVDPPHGPQPRAEHWVAAGGGRLPDPPSDPSRAGRSGPAS